MAQDDWLYILFQLKSTICKLAQDAGHQRLKRSRRENASCNVTSILKIQKLKHIKQVFMIYTEKKMVYSYIDIRSTPKNTFVARS